MTAPPIAFRIVKVVNWRAVGFPGVSAPILAPINPATTRGVALHGPVSCRRSRRYAPVLTSMSESLSAVHRDFLLSFTNTLAVTCNEGVLSPLWKSRRHTVVFTVSSRNVPHVGISVASFQEQVRQHEIVHLFRFDQ